MSDNPTTLPSELDDVVDRLAERVPSGYFAGGEPASEPTAWAGLALAAHGRPDAARQAANWLASLQTQTGTVGVTESSTEPCWPTSLAILLWQALDATDTSGQYGERIERAASWTLSERGRPNERTSHFGHDTTLVGWSWAANTHSWLEPTALAVLALKSLGQGDHPRTREAVRLMVDRLLPAGGCNYGNTFVLGQRLSPHVEPTGLVMMALAGEECDDPRIERSLEYLGRELSPKTTTASLCYGLLGLAAHGRSPEPRHAWLQHAYRHTVEAGASPYKLALVALAAADDYPLNVEPPYGPVA